MGLTTPYRKKIHVQKDIAEETGWPKRRRHGEKKDMRELKITSWNVRTLYRAGALKELPLGIRPKGRPKTRWKDQVHTDMKELKIQYTPDRAEWKKQLDRAKDQWSL